MKKIDKIIFTVSVSRAGKQKQLIIYIPRSITDLVTYQKWYKVTLEELIDSHNQLIEKIDREG